jgi:hypothetical protein
LLCAGARREQATQQERANQTERQSDSHVISVHLFLVNSE